MEGVIREQSSRLRGRFILRMSLVPCEPNLWMRDGHQSNADVIVQVCSCEVSRRECGAESADSAAKVPVAENPLRLLNATTFNPYSHDRLFRHAMNLHL